MIKARVPASVRAVPDDAGRLVLLDSATGRWFVLNRSGAAFYQELRNAADIDKAADAVIARYPAVPADRIRRDVDELVSALVARGLVELPDAAGRHAAGVLMAVPADDAPVGRRWRLTAPLAFLLALLLLRLPFRRSAAVVARLKRAKPEASTVDALSALSAARRASRWYPGRVACVELSLTAVLTAAFLGVRVDWCFGFTVDPYSFHAWIEVDGEPVTHPADEPVPPTYRRVFRT
ncbi:lasso peptide biosynthesis B2 protein [Amycolatopsis sp. MtRt-6]|uniref:lasso peptide biosynthesis B2 protein n=1 Tax=Amycolatopsis sp. MtRt-6 TaxID=2792782 RepID=UPI001A8EB0FE|nr:lasso peptide biosynthesis B2 protein [Amycolatopsis sp. MtRt-6]